MACDGVQLSGWRLYGRRVYGVIRGRVARGVRCRARCVLQGFEDRQNPNSNRRPFVLHYLPQGV